MNELIPTTVTIVKMLSGEYMVTALRNGFPIYSATAKDVADATKVAADYISKMPPTTFREG